MAAVILHGNLRDFGECFTLDVATPAEAVRALCCQLRGLRRRLAEGTFRLVRRSAYGDMDLAADMLGMRLGRRHELHIMPVIAGAKGGAGKALMGLAIVAGAFTMGAGAFLAEGDFALAGTAMDSTAFSIAGYGVSFAQIAGFGAVMLLGGVAQLLSPTPKAAANNASYLFNGAVNATEQGGCVPLVYGEFCAGSVVISAAITVENLT